MRRPLPCCRSAIAVRIQFFASCTQCIWGSRHHPGALPIAGPRAHTHGHADLYKRDYGHAGLYSHCHACAPPSSSKASVSTEFAHANLRSLETDHRGNVAPVPKGTCMWPRARHPQTEGHTRKNRSKEPETLMLTWAPLKRRPGHWMWHLACLPVSGFRRPRPDGKLDPEVP